MESGLIPLKPLDLKRCESVSDIAEGMKYCSFGARMIGEAADTLTEMCGSNRKPVVVYDGKPDTSLGRLLHRMHKNGWVAGVALPKDYAASAQSGGNILVVGPYSERYEYSLYAKPDRAIFINNEGRAKPGQVKDGHFPDVVFANPEIAMPILYAILEERLGGRRICVKELVDNFKEYGVVGQQVTHGAHTLRRMIEDPKCSVFMTISGAMTIAKMGLVVCDMIDEGMVQAVTCTGALISHNLVEGIGLKHYKHNPKVDDAYLAEQEINRVTDTLEPEKNLDAVEEVVYRVLSSLNGSHITSPVELNRMIGEYLSQHYPGERGILKSAYERKVPVFVPAFVDSELGNDVFVANKKRSMKNEGRIIIDLERDSQLLVEMVVGAEHTGIFTIGGGVPRNYVQNVAPLIEILKKRTRSGLPVRQFSYGVRICPDPMWYGHLSGCTYSEGASWRKMRSDGIFAEIPADATIVWPFLVKFVMDMRR